MVINAIIRIIRSVMHRSAFAGAEDEKTIIRKKDVI